MAAAQIALCVYLQKVCALVSHVNVRGCSMLYGLTGVPFSLATVQALVPRIERYQTSRNDPKINFSPDPISNIPPGTSRVETQP